MKKTAGLLFVILTLLFTGCQKNVLPEVHKSSMEEELARIQQVMEEYYNSIHRKMTGYVQIDASSSFMQEYEGYQPDEVVLFGVTVENSENKRYITIGSKDGWHNCSILNEGY